MLNALVVDDDRSSLEALCAFVEAEKFSVETAETLEEARRRIETRPPDVILCDLVLPDGRGTDLLEREETSVDVILVTGHASVDTAVEALRLGAYDYLTKPIDVARLKSLLTGVRRTKQLKHEVSSLRRELRELGRFGRLVGTSSAMQRIYDLVERVAPTDATAFVIGESGTGKEIVAETIHQLSKRKAGPFLPVNCGAITPTLVESELFGHERGSFTGAERAHQGYFERAHRGTLLLDEITEMPLELQVKLLRVLETGEVMRVGGKKARAVDVRVIAASNRVPEAALAEGKLREDLYYRLKVFPLHLPPLRERKEDVEHLVQHFLTEFNRHNDTDKRISEDALDKLRSHSWPGNVRELKNMVHRACILAEDVITTECLPHDLGGEVVHSGPHLQIRLGSSIADAERRLILATLEHCEGAKKEAAEILDISLKTLYNRLNSYRE